MAMSQQNSTKAAVTFCDVAAYFSEEEWKLLHDWQKEIYDNVMKEIQQALISLGPVIAATVFSLKAKEREDAFSADSDVTENHAEHYHTLPAVNCERILQTEIEREQTFMDHLDKGGESGTHKDSAMSPVEIAAVVSFRIKEEREVDSMDHDEHVEKEHKHNSREFSLGNSEVDARVTDPHGADAGESSPCSRSGNAVNILHASFGQEDKGVTYLMDEQFPESNQHIHISTDVSESINPSEQQQQTGNWEGMYTHGDYGQKCDFINQKIIHPFDGKTHESTEHGGIFSQAPKIIKHQRTQKPQKPSASTEHEKYFNDLNLNQHLKMHSGLKQSICSQCGNCFNQSIDMIAPKQGQPQEEQYICRQCESNFYPPTHLNKDKEKHIGQKLFICNDCGKSFKMAQTLLRHQRIHTGERPYICSDCGKSFRQSDALVRHQRIHSGVKPYTCSLCKKNFRQTSHLIRHQQMHMGKNVH